MIGSDDDSAVVPASTRRLAFRIWRPEDLPLAMRLWGDARVSALIGGPFSERQVRERLDAELAQQRQYGVQYWPIFFRDSGEHAGCCGLRPYDLSRMPTNVPLTLTLSQRERRLVELGFHIRAEHWSKGLATEAASSVVEHAFRVMDILGLVAGHHPDNHSSKRVLERLGLRYTHHELYPPTGRQHPSYLLTRDEYRPRSQST